MSRNTALLFTLALVHWTSSPALCADPAATKAAAAAAKAKAQAVVNSPEAAAMKAKAAAALSDMPAQAAKFRQGLPASGSGAQAFTPEQMQKIQAQAGAAFSNMMADPQAAAAAAQGGVTPQALKALQSQSAAAVGAAKAAGGAGTESAAAAQQKAQEFLKSEQAGQMKAQAGEAFTALKADPKFKQSAEQFKEGAQTLTQSPEFQTGVQRFKEGAGTAAQNLKNDKTYRDRGTDPTPGYIKSGATSAKTAADKALVQFCKKFEEKAEAEVPARCKKPKLVPVKQ